LIIAPDTNLLLRAVLNDNPVQSALAHQSLSQADRVILTWPVLVEYCWVMMRLYKLPAATVHKDIELFMAMEKVEADRAVVAVGLSFLKGGGDFADGVIAALGRSAGAEAFVSFDAQAVRLAQSFGIKAEIPA
jgi:predicted nucleic-acid-binding protein